MTDRSNTTHGLDVAEDPNAAGYSEPLHFRGPGNAKTSLRGQQSFLLYWNKRGAGTFYPVGTWNNTDFGQKDQVSRADVLEFRFDTKPGQNLTANDLKNSGPNPGPPLQWRRNGGPWLRPSQRKGTEYYISVLPPNSTGEYDYSGHNLMEGVQSCFVYDEGIRFALRMSIRSKGDAWISDEDHTGSIRMQDKTDRRAYLVAVRYGTEDPFGSQTTFTKREWGDLVG